MTTIGPTYPAQFVVEQAEVKLIADQTSNAGSLAIKADQQNLNSAEEIEASVAHEIDISS
jgi:hypothetical protein